MDYFRKKDDWLVYALSAGGEPLKTVIAMMSREAFINSGVRSETVSSEAALDGNLPLLTIGAKTNKSVSITDNDHYYSDEAAFKEMLADAKTHGYRVLIGIDDIAKTADTVSFLSVLGSALMEPNKDVRFICTGLSKNIEDFVNVPHLSFFVRNESVVMQPLNMHSMALKYRTLLGASSEDAAELAKFTKGYAYAYQVLGEICFNHNTTHMNDEIRDDFDEAMGPQYDLIWSTLTEAEKELVKIIVHTESGAVADVKRQMHSASSFASLRDRLSKKHLISSPSRGSISIQLPRFREYIDLWQ